MEPGTLRARWNQARPEQTEGLLVDAGVSAAPNAPSTQDPPSRGDASLRLRSLPLGGAIALVVSMIAVVSVGMMPLALGSQATPSASTPGATTPGADAPSPSPPPTLVAPEASYVLTPMSIDPNGARDRAAVSIPGSTFRLYEVSAGDNLTRIAHSFGLSVATLYWTNSYALPNPNLVKIGQKLLIPPMDGLVMTASGGDTIDAIADEYGIDAQVIIDANGLPGSSLAGGQLLIIPGVANKAMPRPVSAPKPEDWLNRLAWPVPNHHLLTLRFGCTNFALEPPFGNCRHWHNGLDIGAKWGTPVVAAASGTVIYAGRRKAGSDGAGGGIVVWISHGGTLYTTYNHLSGVTVKAGQRVQAGQQVGAIGATGAADGAHLHFEVWVDYPWTGKSMADAQDPLLYTSWKP